MTISSQLPRRLLWIVNHKTLLPAEVPILRELGWEIFIPKIIPTDEDYRSGVVSFEFDDTLTISHTALQVLNGHAFYGQALRTRPWSSTLKKILNENFDLLITSVSGYVSPLCEATRSFDGVVMARVFGLEDPRTYGGMLDAIGFGSLLEEISERQSSFVFGQGYENLAEIEPEAFRSAARTVTLPMPTSIYGYRDTWRGTGTAAIFLCPAIRWEGGYYKDIYDRIKRDFGSLPHLIFGRQSQPSRDRAVMPYLSEDDLIKLYQDAPVFVYPHTESRHIHYSPVEAMVVGTPVLYYKGSLVDTLAGRRDLAGACATPAEMKDKAHRLLTKDMSLAERIRSEQVAIVDTFADDLAREQWTTVLGRVPLGVGRTQ